MRLAPLVVNVPTLFCWRCRYHCPMPQCCGRMSCAPPFGAAPNNIHPKRTLYLKAPGFGSRKAQICRKTPTSVGSSRPYFYSSQSHGGREPGISGLHAGLTPGIRPARPLVGEVDGHAVQGGRARACGSLGTRSMPDICVVMLRFCAPRVHNAM